MRMKGRNAPIGFDAVCPSGAVWARNAWRTGDILVAPGRRRSAEKRCFLARFAGGVQRSLPPAARAPSGEALLPEGLEPPRLDRAAGPVHEGQVEVQVVEGVEPEPQDLARLEQVAEVRPGERPARVAGARRVGRPLVVGVPRVPNDDLPLAREQQAVAGGSSREDAVEQVDARRDAREQVRGRPDAHEVARLRGGEERRVARDPLPHRLGRLADGVAPERVAGQVERRRLLDRARTQVREEPALRDAEQRACAAGGWTSARLLGLEHAPRLAATDEPALGPRERDLVVRAVGERRRALVERHDDVGAERLLHLDRALRRQELARAVEVRAERDALLGDLDEPGPRPVAPCGALAEAEDLEPAGVREERAAPGHEAVEPAQAAHPLVPGAKEQMVGVPEDDPDAERLEVARLERLHGGRGPHRHEDGGVDRAARGLEPSAARGAVRREHLEADHAAGFPRARSGVKARYAPRAPERETASTSVRHARPARPSGTTFTPTLRSRSAPGWFQHTTARSERLKKPSLSRIVSVSPTSGSCPGQRRAQPPSETLMVVASRPTRPRSICSGRSTDQRGSRSLNVTGSPRAAAARKPAAARLCRSRCSSTPGSSAGRPMRRTSETLPNRVARIAWP